MTIKQICDVIFRLYLYADSTKMIHYSTDKNHTHELADQVRDTILDFVDDLAEQTFGYYGKPKYNDMSLKLDIMYEDDLVKICQHVVDVIEPIKKEFAKNEKLSGTVSLIDDFKGELSKLSFLGSFDKVSNYKIK